MDLIMLLTIFMLAIVGFEVITKVPPTLHTPLMSGSNAISGITVIGALLLFAGDTGDHGPALVGGYKLTQIIGFFALIFATINLVGGFWVTHRMLGMFRKKEPKKKSPAK